MGTAWARREEQSLHAVPWEAGAAVGHSAGLGWWQLLRSDTGLIDKQQQTSLPGAGMGLCPQKLWGRTPVLAVGQDHTHLG